MKYKRSETKVAGYALLVASILVFIIYAYLLLNTGLGILILELTVLAAIAALLAVLLAVALLDGLFGDSASTER